ncbi:extracellular solute-binding protein [Aquibaculum sediminis]|uniref:extracellular solute-binding protein n=1 Tax=Aquibaculum sediminis TaxID=3231907 RepID=UPI003456DDAF
MYLRAAAWALAVSVACVPSSLAQDEESPPLSPPPELAVQPLHGLAMHGDPKYPPDFTHFDYTNPDAPKGGRIRLAAQGTFDSFNPYIVRGTAASGMGYIYETLMVSSADEPFTMYGLLAESIEVPDDRSWAIFSLNPEARWHDGQPVTVEDVIFSHEILTTEGHPAYRYYYSNIEEIEKLGKGRLRMLFSEGENLELPLIAGQMPIVPQHWWETRDFERSSLDPPLGSGPYRVADFEPGRHVTLERVEDYWGADLPVNRGQYNFDRIRYDYYLDDTVIREALKAGRVDLRQENQAKAWALDYNVPAVRDGWLIMEALEHERPTGMQGFVFNTRREIFSDPRVREALAYAFDFEWSNRNLFFSLYARTDSYFSNSELASSGLPDGRELEILEQYRGQVPEEVFTENFDPPSTDGSGWPRENLRAAFRLLAEAGWEVDPDTLLLTNRETGEPMRFEVLLVSPAMERIVLPFQRNLRRLGIEVSVRLVDSSQYINRYRAFDFDMIINVWGQSNSPGNEQREFWSSAAAEMSGSRNLAGVQDPVVDELIELLIAAPSREELVARTRALDRVLLWGHYVIPQYHSRVDRLLYWDKFAHPDVIPDSGFELDTWWYDEERARRLEAREQLVEGEG